MRRVFLTAITVVLSRLPVQIARRCLQRLVSKSTRPAVGGGEKQLLIDVSVIINNDGRTGIQRVVRALFLQLLKQSPVGYRVRPVFATRKQGYHYAPDHFGQPDAQASNLNEADAVKVGPGDIFLGLDLAAHLLPLHKTQLAQWKCSGANLHIVVYDILPIQHPRWFNSKTAKNFHRWLRTVAIFSDSVICISSTVKAELNDWLCRKHLFTSDTIPTGTIPLGADIKSSAPSRGLPDDINQLLSKFASKPTVLMVGTLEPRKGHSQVLAAFDELWQQGRDINLVIVGKPGWKTKKLQQCLHAHPQNKIRLYWFSDASDELLELLYIGCTGVIVASEAEGFGLPLIEAMYYNKSVLARDIPVSREVGGNFVTFFSGTSVVSLKNDIEFWLAKIAMEQMPLRAPQFTWQDSARELLFRLGLNQAIPAQLHQPSSSINDHVSLPLEQENMA